MRFSACAFRTTLVLAAAWAALFLGGAPAISTVVPPPPPHHGHISLEIQQEVNRRIAPTMALKMNSAVGAIAVMGDYGSSGPKETFNFILRDRLGWKS